MCGPCSDGTYWGDIRREEIQKDIEENNRCRGCEDPISLCHCELSLYRLDKKEN